MVEPTQDRNSDHLALRMLRGPRHFTRDGYLLLDALMRSCLVEVDHIGIEHALELLLLKDQQVVEAFLPHTPHEAFADRIGAWRMRGRFENLDATCPRHPSKARPEFAIVITNQVLRCLAKGGGFSQVLGHPGISRRSCHADMDHSSCLELDEEEGKERPKEKVSHRKARHRPRYSPRECGETCSTFDLVAGGCEPSSCTSGWCAYTRVSPISTVPRECAQLPRADFPSPFA